MSSKIKDDNIDFLFNAMMKLETLDEYYLFFEDLCTIPELRAISQRAVVAKMLSEDCVYSDIVKKTGASTATISRVKRSLSYDGDGGYKLVFERMNKD